MVLDQNMSVLEGSIGIFPRRILVGEDEFAAARRLLAEAGFGAASCAPMAAEAAHETSEDAVLGGRLVLRQPLRGHRVGHDAILLAAATRRTQPASTRSISAPAWARRDWRWRGASRALRSRLVEIDPALAALAPR